MLYARVPMERIGVLVGPEGKTKERLEEATGTKLLVDSETGEVTVDESQSRDPTMAMKARDAVLAIGRGFSETRAFRLLGDDAYLQILDIKDYVRSRSRVNLMRGRVIGSNGKTRRIVEDLTGADLSVFGHTVAVIGTSYQLPIVVQAVEMILRGSEHRTVYRFLEGKRAELSAYESGL